MATTPAKRLTKQIGAQKATVTNAWSLMRRIHTHGLNKRRRVPGAAGARFDCQDIVISRGTQTQNESDCRRARSDKIIV
jgi:hypothetical protein